MQLPEAFEGRMKEMLGSAEFERFIESLGATAPTSVRWNLEKVRRATCDVGVRGERVPWCAAGVYLDERPVFTLDPHFHAGVYYVQEASSMYLEEVVKASVDLTQPLKVLDLCAAPGGKSTHLLQLINNESLLVSNEVIRSRASILSENIQKWGKANVVVTNNDPKDLGQLTGWFDLIVVDAPCSGEGLFRKDEEAMKEWSEDNVKLCSLRQRRILSDVWPGLKENGVLIYCTCTYNREEDEENIDWLLKDAELIGEPKKFMPHKNKGEGFFIAAVRKKSSAERPKLRALSLKKSKVNPGWLNDGFDYYELNDLLIALPFDIPEIPNVVTRGIAVATITKNKLVPEHALAMSVNLKEESFPVVDLDKEGALKYLSKQTIEPRDAERGFALMRYQGSNLGFVNRLGNRLNNLYPSNWRIRMQL